jgi:hypothetical protein
MADFPTPPRVNRQYRRTDFSISQYDYRTWTSTWTWTWTILRDVNFRKYGDADQILLSTVRMLSKMYQI